MSQTKTQLVEGLDLASAPADSLIIDSSGRLLVGASTARSSTGAIQVETAGTTDRSRYEAFTNINSAAGPHITLGKSRGTAAGSNTIVQISDELGALNFHGTDGANDIRSAQIKCVVDGTPGTNDMPGRLVFSTTADGASSVTERMRIDSSGNIKIQTNNVNLQGAGTLRINSGSTSGSLNLDGGSTNHGGEINLNGGSNGGTIQFRTGEGSGQQSEKVRIDSSGRLLVGTTSARNTFFNDTNITPVFQVEGANSATDRFISQTYGSAGADNGIFVFAKHRSNSKGAITVVQDDDGLGQIDFQGADGTNFVSSARIRALVDGTPGADNMPGRLVFYTTASGASSPTERLRIDREGNSIFGSAGALNSSDTVGIIPSEGRITFGMDGRTSLVTGEPACYIFSGSGAGGDYPAGTLVLQSRSNENRSIFFATGSTPADRMRIAPNGHVIITEDGLTGDVSDAVLTISSDEANTAIFMRRSGTGRFDTAIRNNGGNFEVLASADSGTVAGLTRTLMTNVNGTHLITCGTTASAANAFIHSANDNRLLRSTSSIAYKKEVEDVLTEKADAVLNLRPVWYRSKAEADRQDWSWYGLIAEEVAEVEPRLVQWSYSEDAYETQINDQGVEEKVLVDNTKAYADGVQYERVTVLLLDVVKRQQQAIKTLEAKVAALEAN